LLDISSSSAISETVSNPGKLAKVLKARRLAASLSLRTIEKQTGISNAYLSQLENGRTRSPSPHVLSKLATVYRVEYSELMEAAGYPATHDLGSLGIRVAMLAGGLDLREQREVASFIETLIARRKRNLTS
jgi:HTH-type transcriptional regulator, competence development regulator